MNKIDTTTIGGEHVVYLIGGNPDFPIIKYYDYYCKVFGEILSRPVVPGDRFKDIREVEWHTNLAGVPESSTKELINEKIDECEKKRKEKIKDLEKNSHVNNADKIKILDSFIFPYNEDDFKVIDGNLVLINWGLVKKEFEAWSPDVINKTILEDFALEEVLDDTDDTDDTVGPVDPKYKDPGDVWPDGDQFGAKNQDGQIEYFNTSEEANSFAGNGGTPPNGGQNDWWKWIIGAVIIIIILFLLRNCNEDQSYVDTGRIDSTTGPGGGGDKGTQGGGGNKGTQGGGGNKGTQGGGGPTGESEGEKKVAEKYLLGEIWEIYDEGTGTYEKYVKEQNTQRYIPLEEYIQTKLPGSI